MRALLISIAAFLALAGTATVLVLLYLFEMPPGEIISTISNEGKLFLFKHELVEKLSPAERKQLYQSNCTRKCHSNDLIENNPRTAAEWDAVVMRMKAPDRADLTDREAGVITRYLQRHFLSNIPTVLSEKKMKFIKRYLWRSDFGEGDLYLDIIYIPHAHTNLIPFLVAGSEPPDNKGAYFVVFLNTHQGTIPPWNVADMVTLHHPSGKSQKAIGWQVLYEDGQHHHNQGILTFPDFNESLPASMEVSIHLPGMRERIFQWELPVPPMAK
ncbi:MAG: hypothetical protein ACE5F3_00285 [Mariprofundaceae bacterium]